MSSDNRQRTLMLLALIVPLAGAETLRFVPIGKAPAKAAAAMPVLNSKGRSEVNPYAFEIPKLDASELNNPITKLYRAAHQKGLEATPVRAPQRVRANTPVLPTTPAPKPDAVDDQAAEAMASIKSLELTSISSGREPVAVIGGRALRVGSMVKKGWKLVAIDLDKNTATIAHPAVGRVDLALKRKPMKDESEIQPLPR